MPACRTRCPAKRSFCNKNASAHMDTHLPTETKAETSAVPLRFAPKGAHSSGYGQCRPQPLICLISLPRNGGLPSASTLRRFRAAAPGPVLRFLSRCLAPAGSSLCFERNAYYSPSWRLICLEPILTNIGLHCQPKQKKGDQKNRPFCHRGKIIDPLPRSRGVPPGQ